MLLSCWLQSTPDDANWNAGKQRGKFHSISFGILIFWNFVSYFFIYSRLYVTFLFLVLCLVQCSETCRCRSLSPCLIPFSKETVGCFSIRMIFFWRNGSNGIISLEKHLFWLQMVRITWISRLIRVFSRYFPIFEDEMKIQVFFFAKLLLHKVPGKGEKCKIRLPNQTFKPMIFFDWFFGGSRRGEAPEFGTFKTYDSLIFCAARTVLLPVKKV